jgi:hypothetical protein
VRRRWQISTDGGGCAPQLRLGFGGDFSLRAIEEVRGAGRWWCGRVAMTLRSAGGAGEGGLPVKEDGRWRPEMRVTRVAPGREEEEGCRVGCSP